MKENNVESSNGRLYILMLSIHGLVRGQDPELGRDADTGGQVSYVLDLARAVSALNDVEKVDLITRKIFDKQVDDIYQKGKEPIAEKSDIIRIECGPRRYLRKELLWPHLDAMVDRIIQYIRSVGKIPDVIHGHYADAGYVGGQLARLLGVPFVFTGHSLGRVKRSRLLQNGKNLQQIERQYNISRRIDAEEFALDTASLVITSTRHEVQEQYELYDNYQPKIMRVIPPGIDLNNFYPPQRTEKKSALVHEISRFLQYPEKPMILAIARADERKNMPALVEAYSANKELQEKANLVIIIGNRDKLEHLNPAARKIFKNIFRLVERYDLYGKVAYPKQHAHEDVPSLYRYAAKTKGIFVNPALTEPFGLTLIEAAASGLPVLATNDGGPVDILNNCNNGMLIDPLNVKDISIKLDEAISDKYRWKKWSKSGIRCAKKHYAWKAHADKYYATLQKMMKKPQKYKIPLGRESILPKVDRIIICDIDNTLIGDKDSLTKFLKLLKNYKHKIGFGIATGRRLNSVKYVLKKWGVQIPDIMITAVGTEIYYGKKFIVDESWQKHLGYRWEPEKIRNVLNELPGIKLQPEIRQRTFKISYNILDGNAPTKKDLEQLLRNNSISANVIYSHGMYIDILPIRASKGLAVRFLAYKWGLTLDRFLVSGDSGNDAEMLSGDTLGVVVGNYSPELNILKNKGRVFFAKQEYAAGILEGMEHYNFLDKIRIPGEQNE